MGNLIDITGTPLTPSFHGKDCLGNGDICFGGNNMKLVAKPWEPQDLLDDLQLMIDELPDSYTNGDRATLCMARDYLKLYFQTPQETAREYAIRIGKCPICQDCPDGCPLENPRDPKNQHE